MKRHDRSEIISKLQQASELAKRGQPQAAICKTLGISVMTFHRWRKEFGDPGDLSGLPNEAANSAPPEESGSAQPQILSLQAENLRLRKIVTDLLLEKAKLEESLLRRKTRA